MARYTMNTFFCSLETMNSFIPQQLDMVERHYAIASFVYLFTLKKHFLKKLTLAREQKEKRTQMDHAGPSVRVSFFFL